MPYIQNPRRNAFDADINRLAENILEIGELNYVITRLALKYLHSLGTPTYGQLNAIVGVFAAAGAEFYRRVVIPYEDSKKTVNGDVYDGPVGTPV